MKILFIPVKKSVLFEEEKIMDFSKKLPRNIAIAYSSQYKDIALESSKILSKKHSITKIIQVLGCSSPLFPKNTKAILLFTDGKFHAVHLAFQAKIPVFVSDGISIEKISEDSILSLEKKYKASYIKYLNADKIGILVSVKLGQQRLNKAVNFRKKIKEKKSYIFITNNINTVEFQNFPEIQSWVNTACQRLDEDNSNIISINRLK
jgi:diphthamide biosynthesis enzyme Dph1/Dph2-like protein